MQSLFYYYRHPDILENVVMTHFMGWMSDRIFLKWKFRRKMYYPLNLDSPKTFNEKIQWLKLYNRRPEYTVMVDKVKAKDYVAGIIGKEYIIPTIGVWESPDEINFDVLPERFVLKVNHNSGTGMYICKDKSKMNVEKVKEGLHKGLKENYYIKNREWPYKNVPRRILAEEYIDPAPSTDLPDYKFFCFDGEVKALFIATGRSKGEHAVRFDFFDSDFNHLPFTNGHPNADNLPPRPKKFEEMKKLAAKLSKGIPHVRIDFYEAGGHIYFGEMTFFHWSGFMPFVPEVWDFKFGEWLKLPSEKHSNHKSKY